MAIRAVGIAQNYFAHTALKPTADLPLGFRNICPTTYMACPGQRRARWAGVSKMDLFGWLRHSRWLLYRAARGYHSRVDE